VAVAVSAGGSSVETRRWADAYAGSATRLVVLSNGVKAPLAERADAVIDMAAGAEVSGMSVRSYVATLVRLLQLEEVLTGQPLDLPARCAVAADAVAWLVAVVEDWVAEGARDLAGPHGTWLLGPAERSGSALQGALMLREGPRRPADGCETGDWSHVDVYLTKTLDYRALVFAGSHWDEPAAAWMRERRSTFWAIGGELDGARRTLRYPGDDDPLVALLAEVTVAELLAAALVAPC
jgi:fructoselysine-6-P-deglycase FrlB-like protein